MPTTRPRHTITETDEISEALSAASRRWPEDRPTALLKRLIGAGHRAVAAADEADRERKLRAVEETEGALTGAYATDYLEHLRDQWQR